MPQISLTDWVDFVIASGPAQLTKVKALVARPEYDPKFDFWKSLREGLQSHHQNGTKLDVVLASLKDPKKIKRFPQVIDAYRKFVNKKHYAWFKPPSALWAYAGLEVRVNPELGLQFDGRKHAVKLYFKEEKPTKQRLSVVLAMMRISLNLADGMLPAVLDVSSCRLITPGASDQNLLPLLQAQAIAFVHMWNAGARSEPRNSALVS